MTSTNFPVSPAHLQGVLLTPKEVALVERILAGESIRAAAKTIQMNESAADQSAALRRPCRVWKWLGTQRRQ